MADHTEKHPLDEILDQVNADKLAADTAAAGNDPATPDPTTFIRVSLHVEFTVHGRSAARDFTIEVDTDGNAGEAAQRITWALRDDATNWIDSQVDTVPALAVNVDLPVPLLVHLASTLHWRLSGFGHGRRGPRPTGTRTVAVPAPKGRQLTAARPQPAPMKFAAVTATVIIGAESKTFNLASSTGGSSHRAATQLARAAVEDLRSWAYDWTTTQVAKKFHRSSR